MREGEISTGEKKHTYTYNKRYGNSKPKTVNIEGEGLKITTYKPYKQDANGNWFAVDEKDTPKGSTSAEVRPNCTMADHAMQITDQKRDKYGKPIGEPTKRFAHNQTAQELTTAEYEMMDKIVSASDIGNTKNKKGETIEMLNRADLEALRNNKDLAKHLGLRVGYDAERDLYGVHSTSNKDVSIFFDFADDKK